MHKREFNSDRFIEGLRKRGYITLGAGCFSVVMAKPGSDRVIKINTRPDSWLDYVLWAAKRGYAGNHAPRVYSYKVNDDGTYVAVVERMDRTLEDVREHKASRHIYDNWTCVRRVVNGSTSHEEEDGAEQSWPGSVRFSRELKAAFTYLDIHSGNYMLRKDGSLVCTDPIAGQASGTAPKRMRSRDLASLHAAA